MTPSVRQLVILQHKILILLYVAPQLTNWEVVVGLYAGYNCVCFLNLFSSFISLQLYQNFKKNEKCWIRMGGVELCIKMRMKRFCRIICLLLVDLPAGQTLCTSPQKLSSTSEGHKKWSPNERFSHLPISYLPDWSLPGKSALLNDKIVRSFDLRFSALS